MDLRLAGRRAVVTGASRGIGRAVAAALVAEGVDVALVARGVPELDATAAALAGHPGRAVVVAADTSDDASVRAMAARAGELLGGPVDILVNAAAPPARPGAVVPLADVGDDAVREQIEVKVLGYLRCARALAPGMVAGGWGRIVNISGLNARMSSSIVGSMRNVAVAAMTKNLADQLGPSGVNVTVVHPGYTVTERTPGLVAELAASRGVPESEVLAGLASATTLRRLVTAEEVAAVVAFLASPLSVAINGDAIAAGGGQPGTIHY
jgi:NAD(P)-dependent dehydrogenase (short-subunit alcohol dehydrogenase family)